MWHLRRQLPILTIVTTAIVCGLALVTGCGGAPNPATAPTDGAELVLFARPRLIAAAGLDKPQQGLGTVRARPYDSGEDILVDLGAGRRADVVEVCSNESAERLARQGLLRPLDTSRIPQWDRLYPVLKDLPGVVVDGEVYMVPVTAAVTGILFNPDVDASRPDSFRDLFGRRHKGHLGFADDPALAFQVAALNLGLPDSADLNAEQSLEAEIYLKHFKKNYVSFWYDLDNLASAFKGGRVTIAVGDRRDSLELQRRGAPVTYTLAAEGQPIATCGFAITTQARDLDAAYALIDYALRPDTQAAVAFATDDLVSNRDTAGLVDSAERARLGLADLARLDRPVARPSSLEHLDWIQAWYEVKKGRG
jgi:spermidine/putrescine transport system substrate-binding protein